MLTLSPHEDFTAYLREVACDSKPSDDLMVIVMQEAFEAGWGAHRKALTVADSGEEACYECARILDEEENPWKCRSCGHVPERDGEN